MAAMFQWSVSRLMLKLLQKLATSSSKHYRSVGHYAGADWRPYQPILSRPYEQLSDEDKNHEDLHLDSWVRRP
jgi:hypothetical protein